MRNFFSRLVGPLHNCTCVRFNFNALASSSTSAWFERRQGHQTDHAHLPQRRDCGYDPRERFRNEALLVRFPASIYFEKHIDAPSALGRLLLQGLQEPNTIHGVNEID